MVSLFAWGDNADGQLGIGGTGEPALVPTRVELRASGVVSVSAGERHTLLLRRDGSLHSCGSNQHQQLGHRSQVTSKFAQILSLESVRVVAAAAGNGHSLAVTDAGRLFSWGLNDCGQLGREDSDDSGVKLVRQLAQHPVACAAAGHSHSLAVTEHHLLFAFGDNSSGQLGQGHFDCAPAPVQVSSLCGLPMRAVACGGQHSAVLSHSGVLFTWGANSRGQLGCGSTQPQAWPTQCRTLRTQRVRHVACGLEHTAALTADGGVFTFGSGSAGQLGHGGRSDEVLPRKVVDLMGSVVTQVACGRMHTLALVASTGRVYGFGLAASGQLGLGSADSCRPSASVVKGPWVPASGSRQFLVRQISVEGLDDGRTPLIVLAGGDQTFLKAASAPTDETLEPDDFRLSRPSALALAPAPMRLDQLPGAGGQRLQRLLKFAVSSLSCHNCAFLAGDCDNPSKANHGIDLDLAAAELSKLADSLDKEAEDQLLAGIVQLLSELRSRNNYPDVECLRFFLLLPFAHLFERPQLYDSLHTDFAHCLLYLHPAPAKIVQHWLTAVATRHFVRLVRIYKRVVLHVLDLPRHSSHAEKMVKDRGINNALDLLKRLHAVNLERAESLPPSTFYMPQLNEKVDIAVDYLNWREQSRRSNSGSLFAFCDYPFIFDGVAKTTLLRADAQLQMRQAVQQAQTQNVLHGFFMAAPGFVNPLLLLPVRRDNLVGDAISHLGQCPPEEFKKPLRVKFVGEDAEDEGGVAKEFFLLIFREILNPLYGMFRSYDSRLIWFHFGTLEDPRLFHLIGILCGLAIYNNFLAGVSFPLAMYKKLLGKRPSLDDLKELDPIVGNNMQQLLETESAGDVEALGLSREVEVDYYGELRRIPLGDDPDEPVTIDNRLAYVEAYVDFVFNAGCRAAYDAFHDGFHKVCGGAVLQMFEPQELQSMLVGDCDSFDWDALQRNAEYLGVYYANHEVIQRFWSVFHRDLNEAQKRKFLLFLTGCDRVPLQGMSAVRIRIQPSGGGENFLPVAHTCYNLLDLPMYADAAVLRRKLTQAIEQSEGFALV